MKKEIIIGADIGGSHISCTAFDKATGKLLPETHCLTAVDGHGQAEEIITAWADTITKTYRLAGHCSLIGIGFAMPGPFDYENGIGKFEIVDKFENLNNYNVVHSLKNKLDIDNEYKIRFINDATAFAIGEAAYGKGSNDKKVAVITLGTGFGSAFIDDKVPVLTGDTVPKHGCVWHLPFKDGIADEYFSTRWFISQYKNATGKTLRGVKDIAEKANQEAVVKSIFSTFGKNLAIFIAPYLNTFDAGVLVIGGNISKAYALFKNVFEETLRQNHCSTKIEISELTEDAAILGCTILFDSQKWNLIQPTLKYM